MVKDNYYFYISGAISLTLFFIISASFSYMLFSDSKVKSYGLKKDKYISISMDMTMSNANKLSNIMKDITIPDQAEENINIDDLFSDVSTKEISKQKVEQRKIDSKRYNEIARKVKTSKIKDVESITEKIKSLKSTKSTDISDNNSAESSADEVNEYLAKIQAIIYNHFNPPQNTQGKFAEVVIELSAIGQLVDFRIIKPSDSVSFNEELKKIKRRLQGVVFPKNPHNKNFWRTVTIKSDKE